MEHDKTMDSRMSHSTRFDLSDVVELISLATVEKIKHEMNLKHKKTLSISNYNRQSFLLHR